MAKHIPVPKWFAALRDGFKTKASQVVTNVKQGLCDHWWQKQTVWIYSADPEKRTVASRKATCVLCNHSVPVDDWHTFPLNTRSEAVCRELAAKIGALR